MKFQESIRNDLKLFDEAFSKDEAISYFQNKVGDRFDPSKISSYKHGPETWWQYDGTTLVIRAEDGVTESSNNLTEEKAGTAEINKMADADQDEIYEIIFGANGNDNHTHGELVEVLKVLMHCNPNVVADYYNWPAEDLSAILK